MALGITSVVIAINGKLKQRLDVIIIVNQDMVIPLDVNNVYT